MAWYKQTAVWGVIISVTALILSQMPPIKSWVASEKVSAEVGSRIGIANTIGIPGFQVFVDIKNVGNRAINISGLTLEVTYPNGTVKRLSAQSYSKILSGQQSAIDFPITSIGLNTGAVWSELVLFYSDFTPSEEEEIQKIRLRISQDIFSKLQARGGSIGPVIAANGPIVAESMQFFNKKFDLEKGKYNIVVKCAVNGNESILKHSTFTLYDYHIMMLKSQQEDYKFGAGIYYPVNQQKQIWALLSNAS